MACLDFNSTIRDPRFNILREWYPERKDEDLATTLAQYWDAHPGNDDWFPSSVSDHRKFTYFMNHGKQKYLAEKTKSTVSADDVSSAYETLSWAYSPTMLQDRLDLLATHFHLYVENLVADQKSSGERTKSRSRVIRDAGGYSGVMGKIFDEFDRYTVEDMLEDSPILDTDTEEEAAAKRKSAEYRLREYKKMSGLRNLLAAQAAPVVGAKENLVVAYSGIEIDLRSLDEFEQEQNRRDTDSLENSQSYNEETVNEDEDNPDDNRDVEATKGDRYTDFRTLRLHETLSQNAKEMLSRIPMLDSQGNIVTDDMGYAKYLDGRQVSYALIYSLENSTQESMLDDLNAATDRYPFLSGVLNFIKQNPDYARTLWCNFHRIGYIYSYIKASGRTYKVSTSNTKAQGYSLMRSAGNYMRSGFVLNQEFSVYDDKGFVKNIGGYRQVPDPSLPGRTRGAFVGMAGDVITALAPIKSDLRFVNVIQDDKYKNVKLDERSKNRYTEAGGIDGMQLFVDENPFVISTLTKALRGLGFDISEKQVKDAAVKPIYTKSLKYMGVNDEKYTDKNRLSILFDAINSAYKRIGDLAGQSSTRIYDTTSNELKRINSILALSLFDELEPRTLENKKALNTFNHGSLLRETFAELRNVHNLSEKEYRKFIQDEYLRYEGYAVEGASAYGDGVKLVAGWLREMLDGNRSGFNVLTQTHFNGVEYADMSRHQKAIAIFLNWLKPQAGSGGYRAYEFPIESDYESAWDFIQAPSYERDEIIDMLSTEVLIEYQRIQLIRARKAADPHGNERVVLGIYEDRGEKFQIFPAMNTDGFIEKYEAAETTEEKDSILKQEVEMQMNNILLQDRNNIEKSGMLRNGLLGKIYVGEGSTAYNFNAKNGLISELGETEQGLIDDFCFNTFFARLQATKMIYGDLSHFTGILDFEKRNMMAHATGSPIYTGASYNGKSIGMKDHENVMYLGDEVSKSYFAEQICAAIDKSEFLSPEQKEKAKKPYQSNIKSTDGQGYRTLDSAREILIASDGATGTIWTDEHEKAYLRIKNGDFRKKDADLFLNLNVNFQNVKPVLSGHQHIDAADGNIMSAEDENEVVLHQKPIKTPVLHKYSEAILLPYELLGVNPQMESSMYGGLSMAADKLGRKVDLFLFHSDVKVGYHDGVDAFGYVKKKDADGYETKENLLDADGNPIRRNHTAEEVRDYIVNSAEDSRAIQKIPYKYYRIAASTGAHIKDTEISWSTQAQKNIWSNYDDNEEVSIRGHKMNLAKAHETSNNIDVATVKESYDELLKEIGDLDKLEELLQTELALKDYNSREMRWALTRLKNGDFVSPLGNPSIMSGIEQLLFGLMKKRLTKPTAKGANVIQVTSLGLDRDPFNPNEKMNPNHKLGIEFDEKTGNLVAIDCYLSIHDTRLEQFADENGAISPERLKKLCDDGVIDRNILKFVAYRTPSDDLHSILPLRIKGFISGIGGANIIVPKEVMNMTGHDFDGDKLRCHFIEFEEIWDEDLMRDDYEEFTKFDPVRATQILAQNPKALESVESYIKFAKSRKNPWRNEYVKMSSVKYDYSKSAYENNRTARDNAKVELAYARLTSDSGTSLIFVPGGAADTSQYAKTIFLTKAVKNNAELRDYLSKQGVKVSNANAVYQAISAKSLGEIDVMMDIANGSTTPFSFSHALDAYDYIIGGAKMIDVNAMYSSAFKLFQKAHMSYRPRTYKKGNKTIRYDIRLFNHKNPVTTLFDIKNADGLASMTYARFVNAAVDNGKDPILGLVDQVPELAELTFFLAATNNSEEEIHLFLNQPVMVEAVKRMKESKKDLDRVLDDMFNELVGDGAEQKIQKFLNPEGEINKWHSLDTIKSIGKDRYIDGMVSDYAELNSPSNLGVLELQLSIIGFIKQTAPAVNALADLVKLTRPDSSSSGIDSTVSGTAVKVDRYREYCNRVLREGNEFPIEGAEIVLPLSIGEWTKDEDLEAATSHPMGQVQMLNSVLVDGSLDIMSWFFPQARESWTETAMCVAKMYRYRRPQKNIVRKVMADMMLFKLLGNKGFIKDIEATRKDVVVNMPKELSVLKTRIRRAKEAIDAGEEVLDKAVIPLIGNKFLEKIEVYDPHTPQELPRLKFDLGGPTTDTLADEISSAWAELERSKDKDIKQIGRDLFMYNILTAGLSYGMYEFLHFAPMNIVINTPGYIKALNSISRSNFKLDSVEGQRFVEQYILNHWGDNRLLYKIDMKDVPVKGAPANPNVVEKIKNSRYYVRVNYADGGPVYYLFKVTPDESQPFGYKDEPAKKLGFKGYYGQMTLQYNPELEADDMIPLQTGDDSNWHFDMNSPYAEANISGSSEMLESRARINDEANSMDNLGKRMLARFRDPMAQQVNDQASANVDANKKMLEEAEEPLVADNGMHFYRGRIEPEPGVIFVFGSNPEGRHGAGAARVALDKFYARYGQGAGIQGNAYAIPTKDLRVKANNSLRSISPESIIESIRGMYDYARRNPDKVFKVAYTNAADETTLNGYTGREMFDMFEQAGPVPGNVEFSEKWMDMANHSDPAEQMNTEAPQSDIPAPTANDYTESVPQNDDQAAMMSRLGSSIGARFGRMKQLKVVQRTVNDKGETEVRTIGLPVSPYGIGMARRQQAYVELNDRLRQLYLQKGISVGSLTNAEELLNMNGIADFDTPKVLANGLIEMVRISDGIEGEYALPEEFAHIAVEMVGHDQPVIRRLIDALKSDRGALASAFDGTLDAYIQDMGDNVDEEALAVEGVGKLIAKKMFQHQALQGHSFLRLLNRVIDFIKSVFRRFSTRELHDAIYETEQNASKIARDLIDGRLLDGLSVESIHSSGQMKQLKVDISDRNSALERILKNELKKLDILQKRKSAAQRDEQTPFEVATLSQIKKLEEAIRNDKSEKAILDYFTETLDYLADVEKEIDSIIENPNANRNAGFVCRKLADVRDTIDCYAAIADDISKAITDKEISSTRALNDIVGNVQSVVSKFYKKCNNIGMQYAEEAMKHVYGEDGRSIQIGKDRGKNISVREMLTNARRDVSLAVRWAYSLADSGDEVLMAIDSLTREAKQKARKTMLSVKPRIEKAFADFVRATGSRDQNFMFERDANGHRTGFYRSEDSIKSRYGENSAQYKFYKEMMAIKHEVDKVLPPTYVGEDKIVMLRKRPFEKLFGSKSVSELGDNAHEAIRNMVMDTSDTVDFDNKEVTVDFLGNRVDRLIPMFCNKGVNETFDDMTDDVASSILAYAGMGYEYSEMNNVVFVLENLKYMGALRDVQKTFGGKPMRETIGDPDPTHDSDTNYFYHRPYTVKQAKTNLQEMVDAYFYMHVYGHRYAAEGNIRLFGNDTKVSKQKLANMANGLATWSQMALNLQQRITNIATGATNIIIESVGGGVYNAKDVAWATKEYMKHTPDRLTDTGKTETDNYLSLFAEYFDVHQNNGATDPKYKKGRASKVFNGNLLFAGLQAGEDYLAITTALAAARNYRVKDENGHERNLYEAYEVKYLDEKNRTGAYLQLKKGWTKADGTAITEKDERDFMNLVAGLNFQLQGIYNLDDKSAMQQYALGSLLIMYRKWIAPALKRRYSKPKYNILTQQDEEGYYVTLGKHVYDSLFGVDGMISASYGLIESFKLNYSKLTDYEKSNIRRAMTEAGTLLATIAAIFLLEMLPPDKDKENEPADKFLSWAHNQMLVTLLRERNEIGSIAPTPMFFKEAMNTLGSPFAAWRPLQKVLHGFLLLWPPSYWTPVKSGTYKGHSKAYKYFWELPVLSMKKQVEHLIDQTPVINYYKNNIMG